jgi:membrane protease YdiL (CAAX protease family)
MWALLRTPHYIYLAAAVAFPIGADLVLSVGHYLVDRTLWAAHDFGRLDAPQFASYFGVPHAGLFLMVFPAFFEEMIFRGVLQTQFLRWYGVYRGLFLVGIVWAASHFSSDFSFSGASDFGVVRQLGVRLFMCLTLSCALGWLTLRSKSRIPATIAHTLYDAAASLNAGLPFAWKATVRVALLGALAVALFRWWPVDVGEDLEFDGKTLLPDPSPDIDPSVPAWSFGIPSKRRAAFRGGGDGSWVEVWQGEGVGRGDFDGSGVR